MVQPKEIQEEQEGGGVIRNDKIQILWAYAEDYGVQTNHMAKAKAPFAKVQ